MKKPKDKRSPMHPVIRPVLAQKSIFSPVLERRQKISARADAIIPGKHAQENTIPPIPKIMDAFAILLLFSIALLLSFVTILPFFPCLVNRANFLKISKTPDLNQPGVFLYCLFYFPAASEPNSFVSCSLSTFCLRLTFKMHCLEVIIRVCCELFLHPASA